MDDSRSRLRGKRSSCNTSGDTKSIFQHLQAQKEASIENGSTSRIDLETSISRLNINMTKSIVGDRENLIKFLKPYVKKHNEVPETTLDFYKIDKVIGKGAFGKVILGVHKLTGKNVAIKTIEKSYMNGETEQFSRRKVFQEIYILKKIRHSNVIRLLEVFESTNHLLMVMEYAGGGDLLQHVKGQGRLSELDARIFFRQILYGLGHCHCRSVLHRDVKLDNILIGNSGQVKICDFGVSKIISNNKKIFEQCGTPAYIAPEIISDKGYEGYYVDIWSLGVLLYAMVCGAVPFKANNMQELYTNIMKKGFTFPVALSKEVRDLIRKMLNKVPNKRIMIPEILNHPWVTSEEEFDVDYEESDIGNDSSLLLSNPSDLDSLIEVTDVECSNDAAESTHDNINYINVDNLFCNNNFESKLNYNDYKSLTEDFATMHIDEDALSVLEGFGYPRSLVKKCLNRGDMNHATT